MWCSKLTPETAVIIDLAPYRFFHWLFTGCAQGASLCHSHQVTKCLGLRLCSYSREGRLVVLCQQCRIPSQQLHVRAPQAPPRNELGSKGTLNRRVGTLLAGYWAGSLRGARIRMRPETGATRIQDLLLGVPKKGLWSTCLVSLDDVFMEPVRRSGARVGTAGLWMDMRRRSGWTSLFHRAILGLPGRSHGARLDQLGRCSSIACLLPCSGQSSSPMSLLRWASPSFRQHPYHGYKLNAR